MQDNREIHDFAVSLARTVGDLVKSAFSAPKEVAFKGEVDIVTETDQRVEQLVLDAIRDKFPTHLFVGEESVSSGKGKEEVTDDPTWIIDPIDGTTNFVARVPHLAISIGFAVNKQVVVGVVYNPILNEMFTATKGGGAFKNGAPIKISSCNNLKHAVVATGFPYDRTPENLDKVMATLKNVLVQVRAIRRLGSAALDMCYVASGVFEAYYEKGVDAWDIAAGSLILKEAGGTCDSTDGTEFSLCNRQILATNGHLRKLFVELVKQYT